MTRSSAVLVVCALTVTVIARLPAGTLPAALASKLHPSLRALAATHGDYFHGAPVFDALGASIDETGVIIHASDVTALRRAGIRVQSVRGTTVTARIRVRDLETLCAVPGVDWIDPGSVNHILSDVSVPETGALLAHGGFFSSVPRTGKGVIIVIYDTGIDYTHADFRDPTDSLRTRILSIWDQTLTPVGTETSPPGFTYGVEYSKAQIESELKTPGAGIVRQKDVNGHGTHVAGIAAGNGCAVSGKYAGMAPEADIVVVKGGNGSFSEPSMIDGLQYAANAAVKYGRPVVLNWSIGGQGGPHDGTRAYEEAVDDFVLNPGRVVCISAGNDGSSGIHRSGTLPPGASDTIRVSVPSYVASSGRDDDAFTLDAWTRSAGGVDAAAISPSGILYVRTAETSGDCADNADGTITLWNYNAAKMNRHRNIQLYVHDKTAYTPKQGAWKLALKNTSAEPVQFDVWLSSRTVGGIAVALTGGDNSKTVAMPATSAGAITVGSSVARWSWPSMRGQFAFGGSDRTGNISLFSSIGPTADGRQKPDLTAPGQPIVAALSMHSSRSADGSQCAPDGKHVLMSGTSMAAPHATGACALLLSIDPSLTAAQLKSVLLATAATDAYTSSASAYYWGAGKIDAASAVARMLSPAVRVKRRIVAYDSGAANSVYTLTGSAAIGVRITPPDAGVLTRVLLDLTTANNRPIAGTGRIICSVFTSTGGVPAVQIGVSSALRLACLNPGTLNSVPFGGQPVRLEKGEDYFLVVSLADPSDTVKLRTDQAPASARSVAMTNGMWTAYAGNFRLRGEITSTQDVDSAPVDVVVPQAWPLAQNFPNPFNPSTSICYTVPKAGGVTLTIYDVVGRVVATLVHGMESAGRHAVSWNGRTHDGRQAAAGVYFYRLETESGSIANKMVLLR